MSARRDDVEAALGRVRERIDAACSAAGRDPAEVTLVVVTKFFPASDVRLPGGAEGVELTVRDNGIGFDEKYLDRIFTPFQRLHSQTQYRGTGMGLAVCRKIAERHGGRITARSRPGEGATFVVTVPRRQPVVLVPPRRAAPRA